MTWGPQSTHMEPKTGSCYALDGVSFLSLQLSLSSQGWPLADLTSHLLCPGLPGPRPHLSPALLTSRAIPGTGCRAVLTCFSWSRALDLSFAPPHLPFQGPGLFKNKFNILFGSHYVSFYFKIQPLVKADRTIYQQEGRCEVEQNGWEERSPASLRAPGRPGRDVATLLQFPHWGQSSQGWGCGFRPEAAKREAGMGRP